MTLLTTGTVVAEAGRVEQPGQFVYTFTADSDWDFFGFSSYNSPINGNLEKLEVVAYKKNIFETVIRGLQDGPVKIIEAEQNLSRVNLNVYEAYQWLYVEKVLESNAIGYVTLAEPIDSYVLRQDEADAMQIRINELVASGQKGAFKDHRDESNTDNEGAILGLIVGIVMFALLLCATIKKFMAARNAGATTGAAGAKQDTKTLVNANNPKSDAGRRNSTPGGRNLNDL
jgi:hypothetical protein